MVGGEERFIRVFIVVSFIFTRVCVWASVVVLKKDFSNVFVRSKSLETLL